MPGANSDTEAELTLELLSAVEEGKQHSQRLLAKELGVALGLTNSYVKRCIRRGWLKATQAPPNRYGYYLTPKGFAEKSRLTARYLRSSFSFYRRVRNELDELLETSMKAGETKIVLAGRSEIAEIAVLCASQYPVEIVAVLDPSNEPTFLGATVVSSLDDVDAVDAVIVTDTAAAQKTYDTVTNDRPGLVVRTPSILRITMSKHGQQEK